MYPALTQRLVTFNTYFYGFLILDRLSFFGEPPSTTESWLMALTLGLVVTFASPFVARWMEGRAERASGRAPRRPRATQSRPKRDRPGQRSSGIEEPDEIPIDPVDLDPVEIDFRL